MDGREFLLISVCMRDVGGGGGVCGVSIVFSALLELVLLSELELELELMTLSICVKSSSSNSGVGEVMSMLTSKSRLRSMWSFECVYNDCDVGGGTTDVRGSKPELMAMLRLWSSNAN